MSRINAFHVGAGGVVAGTTINVIGRVVWTFILPNRMMAGSYTLSLVVGTMTVWLYASLRADSDSSRARAVLAGVIVWMFTVVAPNYVFWLSKTVSGSVVVVSSAFGMLAMVAAALAGAWIYNWAREVRVARTDEQRPRIALSARATPHTPLSARAI